MLDDPCCLLVDHVANEEMPPLMIFPQGTCSAITTLTTFKKGAFLSGQPVQPVGIQYVTIYVVSYAVLSLIFEFVSNESDQPLTTDKIAVRIYHL